MVFGSRVLLYKFLVEHNQKWHESHGVNENDDINENHAIGNIQIHCNFKRVFNFIDNHCTEDFMSSKTISFL